MYGPALAALREIVAYAADLLLRSYRSAPGTCEDSVVIVCHFRQVVATADAATLLLSHGAAYMARLPARSLVEATIALLWTLKQGKVRWGRQYYVASLRHYREWQLRGAGEAYPHREAINRLWRRVIDEPAPAHPGGPSMAKGDIDEAESLLGSDAFVRSIHGSMRSGSRVATSLIGSVPARTVQVGSAPTPRWRASLATNTS